MTATEHPHTAGRFVGQKVPRKEDPRLLTGHGRYIDDVTVTGMLHETFVRSDLARAAITRIDVEAARTAVPLGPYYAPLGGDRTRWVPCHNYGTARTILSGAM